MNPHYMRAGARKLAKPLWILFLIVCALCVIGSCDQALHHHSKSAPPAPRPSVTWNPPTDTQQPPASPPAPPEPAQSPLPTTGGLSVDMLNPDVTQATISTTICVSGWTKAVRPPVSYTEPIKVKDLAVSNYTDKKLSDYELDHFVPLELGGAPRNTVNLWPEPYNDPGGAGDKDSEENSLHRQVCAHQLTLAQAQAKMWADWSDEYLSWR